MNIWDQLRVRGYEVVVDTLILGFLDNSNKRRELMFRIGMDKQKLYWRVLLDDKFHYADSLDQLLIDIEMWGKAREFVLERSKEYII